ncbi:recombinase RecT [Streptomyces sp. NPDC094143]|uniref:recombinase RecT n=1 Tax=Streptomyces sp. NPDC094143 TaxID=3155310 RepID=UPI00332C3155
MSQIGNAIEKRDQGPAAVIEQYKPELALVAASHVKVDTFARLAVGVLRQNEKLATAASSSPGSLMSALMTAARLGLEPGTEQFYLRPIKRKGVWEVQGIVGYQGIVELIYNAGAADSVVVEVVKRNDRFEYVPGRHDRPIHEVDWFGDRGPLVGAYAYAVMRGGAVSKVVVLNRNDIDRAKAKADGANTEYSPWRTDEEAMWLKTAVRRLGKWVPTSAEKLALPTAAASDRPALPAAPVIDDTDPDDEGPIEGELVD